MAQKTSLWWLYGDFAVIMPSPFDAIATQLESTFHTIQVNRMADVPVLNEQLQVKAIKLQAWQGSALGILISPWFMNIMLLPMSMKAVESASTDIEAEKVEKISWNKLTVGQEITHVFPSGRYTFVVGYEEDLGFYQSCSLFSPMFEFENQQAAEITAVTALDALFDSEQEDTASQHPAEAIEKIWKGEAVAPAAEKTLSDKQPEDLKTVLMDKALLQKKLDAPLSRRDFLRGRVLHQQRDNSDNKPTKT